MEFLREDRQILLGVSKLYGRNNSVSTAEKGIQKEKYLGE